MHPGYNQGRVSGEARFGGGASGTNERSGQSTCDRGTPGARAPRSPAGRGPDHADAQPRRLRRPGRRATSPRRRRSWPSGTPTSAWSTWTTTTARRCSAASGPRTGLQRSGTPVLGLTRRGDLKTKLQAFDLGVDDILTMPFSPEELLARAIVITRRASGADAPIIPTITLGEIEVDILNREVRAGTRSSTCRGSSRACSTCWQAGVVAS